MEKEKEGKGRGKGGKRKKRIYLRSGLGLLFEQIQMVIFKVSLGVSLFSLLHVRNFVQNNFRRGHDAQL